MPPAWRDRLCRIGPVRGEITQPVRQALDRVIEEKADANLVPGIAVVVMEGEEVAYSFCRGAAGAEPITPETPFIVGSISKLFTATAVMQLVDRGRVELDAPVQRYLPEFRVADAEAARRITVRQLLNQNSGLPTDAPRATGVSRTLSDHVIALSGVRLAGAPGGGHIYSSPNYQVLGALVEKVSGQSFGDYLPGERLHSSRYAPFVHGPQRGQGERPCPGQEPLVRAGRSLLLPLRIGSLADGFRHHECGDLGRLLAAHLQNGRVGDVRILSESAARLMHEGAAEARSFKYAMGLRAGPTAGVPSLWHGGAVPNYRGAVVLLPEEQKAVVVLTNMSTMMADHTREIAAAIVATLQGRPLPVTPRSLRNTYLAIAAVSLVLLLVQTRSLVRAWRAKRVAAVIPTLIFDLGLPIAILVVLPHWLGVSLRGMIEGAPDIALFVALLIMLSLTTGLVKLWRRSASAPTTEDRVVHA